MSQTHASHDPIDPGQEPSDSEGSKPSITALSLTRRSFVVGSAALCGNFLTPGPFPWTASVVQGKGPATAGRLADRAFRPLPLGSVKARGWLLRQLELQRDGLTGKAEKALPDIGPDSGWKGGGGEDWEKGPYYLKGLLPLAYTLDDETLKKRAQTWIEPILSSQREDGSYGPKNDDWWPRMVVNYLLRDYHEATKDPRVVPFLVRYYRFMARNLPDRPLREWGKARAGDEIDTILWLYERTGDDFLLALTDLLANQAYPWTEIFHENRFLEFGEDFHPSHNVNVPQALKLPVVYSRRSGNARDRQAYRAGLEHLMRDHGTAFGICSGSEKLSGRSTLAGVETCSIVEYMLSAETAMHVLGDARIGDELERVAFNALPAAISKDFHQHVYYTLSNNVAARRGGVGYSEDHADARTPAPRSGTACCCFNLHMGWPKLVQNAWGVAGDGGLAALAYVPSEATFEAKGGERVGVVCDTAYPFEETVRFQIRLEGEVEFPLHLRIPGWCDAPLLLVDGQPQEAPKGRFAIVERKWKNGDRVELRLPMRARTSFQPNGWVSVERGPLVYALGLDERWIPFESRPDGFGSYEVTTDAAWNYALVPEAGFDSVERPMAANPFATGDSPVALRAKARRLESWRMRFDDRLPLDPPASPVEAKGPLETLTLVPFGSQMLRVSVFPVAGASSPRSSVWKEDFSPGWQDRLLTFQGCHVRDGRLRLALSGKAIALDTSFGDFLYEGEVTVGAKGDAGLLFRVADPSVGTDHYRGYYIGLRAEDGQAVLGKSDNAWEPLVSRPAGIERGRAHRVRVEAIGKRIRIWVGDVEPPTIEIQDDSFARGSLGVRSYGDEATFGPLSAHALA